MCLDHRIATCVLCMQLHLPIQPPLALLANRLAEGMLGLRWAKVKVGSGSNAMMKTVQVTFCYGWCLRHSLLCFAHCCPR